MGVHKEGRDRNHKERDCAANDVVGSSLCSCRNCAVIRGSWSIGPKEIRVCLHCSQISRGLSKRMSLPKTLLVMLGDLRQQGITADSAVRVAGELSIIRIDFRMQL